MIRNRLLLLVTLIPTLSFASPPSNQQILANIPTTLHEYSIYNYGARCDGSTNDSAAIVAAETAAAAAGGGMVTGYGICAVSTAMTFNDPRVLFVAKNVGNGSHDVGSNDASWTLKWTGAGGATMMTIVPTAGAGNQALWGNGAQGITFDCNNSAGIGLQLGSVKGGTWRGLYFLECTTVGLDVYPLNTSQLGEAPDPQNNIFSNIRTRILSSTGIGIRLRGASSGGANTSFDLFEDLQITYHNGTGMQVANSDNLIFMGVQMIRGGSSPSGIGVELTGDTNNSARSNFFYDLSPGTGGVTIRGTETNPVAVQNIQFIGYDLTNAPPAPVLGTGVTGITIYKENGHFSGSGMVKGMFGESDANLSLAFTNCGVAASICIYDTSQGGIRFFDGTGTWHERQDASHNLLHSRQAGTGSFLMDTGVPLQIALNGAGTVAALPTCNAAAKGQWFYVTDANAPTYNATVAGSGAITIPVMCDGTNWKAH